MGSLFSKPKMPDTSRQESQIAAQDAKLKAQEEETRRRDAASLRARQSRARSSLITGGNEQGVMRDTLG